MFHLLKSFTYALIGMRKTLQNEYMFRFYLSLYLLSIMTALYLQFNTLEFIILLFCGATLLSAELMNTAVEKCVDLIGKRNSLAAFAKDAAAGAVAILGIHYLIILILLFLFNI